MNSSKQSDVSKEIDADMLPPPGFKNKIPLESMDIWDKFKQIYLEFSRRYNNNMEKPDLTKQIEEIYDFIDKEFKQNGLEVDISDLEQTRWVYS